MRNLSARVIILAALLGAAATAPAFASGSYAGRTPQPPAKSGDGMAMKMDREKYGLGQKVYDGSVMTPGGGDAGAQVGRLKTLQMKLPAETAKMKDFVALAGKLTDAQLAALEYFVEERFAMKK